MIIAENELYSLTQNHLGDYTIKNKRNLSTIEIEHDDCAEYISIKESIEIMQDLPQLGVDAFFNSIKEFLPN